MDIAVLGPGAVGGYLAAALWKAGHSVTCVAREATAARISSDGLRVRSVVLGDLVARTAATPILRETPDLLLIATKATGLPEALSRVRSAGSPSTAVVPLLNGVEHMVPLRGMFARVCAGSIRIESIQKGPASIEHTSPFVKIDLSRGATIAAEQLSAVKEALTSAKVEVDILATDEQVLWRKLARLNAIACTTTASGLSIGPIRTDPHWRAQLQDCLLEGARVAEREGVAIDVEANMRLIDGLPFDLGTSMQRDLAGGRPIELDAIAGAVVRAGRRHGIACPATEDLMMRILSRQERAGAVA